MILFFDKNKYNSTVVNFIFNNFFRTDMNFQDFYPIEQFSEAFDSWIDDSSKKGQEKIVTDFFTSMAGFLELLKKETMLPQSFNATGHSLAIANAWNRFAGSKATEHDLTILKEKFARKIIHTSLNHVKLSLSALNDNPQEDKEKKRVLNHFYQELTHSVTEGDFSLKSLNITSTCSDCGQEMELSFSHWCPTFHVFEETNGVWNYEEPKNDCSEKSVIELTINFSSGNVLATDWFRIPGLNELLLETRMTIDEKLPSINYAKGRQEQTQYYASKNIITVSTGNVSPCVFQAENSLVIGQSDESYLDFDEEDNEDLIETVEIELDNSVPDSSDEFYRNQGQIDTELWAVTLIEKENLIEILTPLYGKQAPKVVEEYIKDNEVLEITIEPGQYVLSFMGNTKDFAHTQKTVYSEDEQIAPLFKLEKYPELNKKYRP